MGEWTWVVVGYAAMVGSLAAYTWWLQGRLRRATDQLEKIRR